jgi:CheY-like chemotaxis protein
MNDDRFTILLAEDDENDAWMVKRALNWGDIHNPVQVVPDGEEAIAYLRGDGKYKDRQMYPMPKLLLLDIKMPRKYGWEVLEWIRGTEANGLNRLPVIIMSSSNVQEDIDRAYELGVNAYLVKPNGFGELVKTLQTTTDFWKETVAHPQILAA